MNVSSSIGSSIEPMNLTEITIQKSALNAGKKYFPMLKTMKKLWKKEKENYMENNQIISLSNSLPIKQWWEDPEKIKLLKNTICRGTNDNELQLFLHACQRTGLDPFMKQIHAVKRGDIMTIQTGIDGFRLIAERTGNYSPGREPTFVYDKDGELCSSTAYVKKRTLDGTWHEVAATAFFSEYCQKTRDGNPTRFWKEMKHNQLAKCAEALALRKAFPADLSGLYTQEEMQQADIEVVETKRVSANAPIQEETAAMAEYVISVQQSVELEKLIKQCESGYREKLLNFFKIKSWSELPEKEFTRAKDAMIRKIEKLKEQEKIVNDFEKFSVDKKEVAHA